MRRKAIRVASWVHCASVGKYHPHVGPYVPQQAKRLYFLHTQIYTELATKNIAISEEAYQRLKALKKPGESFTEVIERMTRSRDMQDLAGVLSKEQASAVSGEVREMRERTSRRLQRTIERLS